MKNLSHRMATQHSSPLSHTKESMSQRTQPLVWAVSAQRTEAAHDACFVTMRTVRRAYCWADVWRYVGAVCTNTCFRWKSSWSDVRRRVQSCNPACVFRLLKPGLTANQQFGSSVTQTENMCMFEVGFRISFQVKSHSNSFYLQIYCQLTF